MENVPIRVVLAESSPLSLKILERMLADSPSIEIVGSTRSGREAMRLVGELHPAVLCIGIRLAEMTALEVTQQVMANSPVPILVMCERILPGIQKAEDAAVSFALIEAGAVDVWVKPAAITLAGETESGELATKIKRLSRVPVISRPLKRQSATLTEKATAEKLATLPARKPLAVGDSAPKGSNHIVLIGASTGGPQALLAVLSALPRDFPAPILCVQHISKGFLDELIVWLDRQCALTVEIAQENTKALPGHVYFPSEDTHLEVDSRARLHLSNLPQRDGHRPSVTVTFESGASSFGSNAVAVLLTGMGSDGAMGLRAVRLAGGATIAQNEASCVVFGMPRVAIELGAAQFVMAPAEIARKLLALVTA
jgi:two-component system chemotaxis response regulator CheB